MPKLTKVYESAFCTIERTGAFISVFVPLFAGISAATGAIASAGGYNLLILAVSELIVKLSDSYFMPIVTAVSVLGICGSVFSDLSLEAIGGLIKKVMIWVMTITMSLFTGFVSLKCTITGKADGAAAKAVKYAVSGAVPVVGGAVSDAFAAVKGSFDVLRSTIGAAGAAAAVVMILPVVIEIIVYRFIMWTGSAAAELMGADTVKKLLDAVEGGLAIAQSVLVCYGLMFIICTGILISSMG
jgi:stage III sporulation protein AE